MVEIDKNELAKIVSEAVAVALSERRKEDFNPPHHTCLLSDEEKQAIKELAEVFRQIRAVKWKLFGMMMLVIAGIVLTSFSIGFKTWCRSWLQ